MSFEVNMVFVEECSAEAREMGREEGREEAREMGIEEGIEKALNLVASYIEQGVPPQAALELARRNKSNKVK
jgi:predicted transposase YdaD